MQQPARRLRRKFYAASADTRSTMQELTPGTLIGGKYVITELIGSGGMGHVYHARHQKLLEFEVAIKVLDPALTSSVENRDRFRNEVLAGYRATHPHIVQMYEYFDLGMTQAFAMEFVSGGTLAEAMLEGPLPIDLALTFIKQIARGLAAFHKAGTLHRDLKPANVLLTESGVAKLTDFGVARVRGGVSVDDKGLLAGTPQYVPPEYVRDGESDHRGDIYALGVLAYEMLAGGSPFVSQLPEELLRERLEKRGADLMERVPGIPHELSRLVERCMAVDVIQRFPHAHDIADAVSVIQKRSGFGEPEEVEAPQAHTRLLWRTFLEGTEGSEQGSTLPQPMESRDG